MKIDATTIKVLEQPPTQPSGDNPVNMSFDGKTHDISVANPQPQNPAVGSGLINGQPELTALNNARRSLNLPVKSSVPDNPLSNRKIAPGDSSPKNRPRPLDAGNGLHSDGKAETGFGDFEVVSHDDLKTNVDRNGAKSVTTGVGEFQEIEIVNNKAVVAKADVKVAATDFKAIVALLASGKPGTGLFSIDRQTRAITTVNDNLLSILNPSYNPALSGLLSTSAENRAIRRMISNALLVEIDVLRNEAAAQKKAVTGTDSASERIRAAIDKLLKRLVAMGDEIQKTIQAQGEKNHQQDPIPKALVKTFTDELVEIGKALRTPPDSKTVSDYRQALDRYRQTLDDYRSVLTANQQKLTQYESDCREVAITNRVAQEDYQKALEKWKTDAELKEKQLEDDAENEHKTAHERKVDEYGAFVTGRKNGLAAHLSDLKTRFGTDQFDTLEYLKDNIFTKEPGKALRASYLQLKDSTSGALNYYYYGFCDYSKVAENNKAARLRLQASLAHALWEAGLEDNENGQKLIAQLGGDALGKTLDYEESYATVKGVFDLIDNEGVKAPGKYTPLTKDELAARVRHDPPPEPAPPQPVEPPQRPQLDEVPPLGRPPAVPVLKRKSTGDGTAALLEELALARQEKELAELQEPVSDLKTRQAVLAQEGLALQEGLIKRKYGVESFQSVFKLAREKVRFRDYGNRGKTSVTLDNDGILSWSNFFNPDPSTNRTIRLQLMASFERETWLAGLSGSKRMQTFLAHAEKALRIGNPDAMGEWLDYVDAFELLHEFQMSVAAENPAFVATHESPTGPGGLATGKVPNGSATVPAEAPETGENVAVRPAGDAPTSMGSLGLSYAQFGGQLLNPLVEHLFEGMGVALSGVSLTGDEHGLTLKIEEFDASGTGMGAADELLTKYSDVVIPITATWQDGRLSFELGNLGCTDTGKAQRLNTLVKIARESGALGGLATPAGMSVTSGATLGVTCDFKQMDVAMLTSMGFGANLAETIGGVRFSGKGVMIDFGKVDDESELPQLNQDSGAMEVHLNVSTVLDRCHGFLTKMMREALGMKVGSIGASTTADGIVKFSFNDIDVKDMVGGWAGTLVSALGMKTFSSFELSIRPTLNAETGLLEISLVDMDFVAGSIRGNLIKGLAKQLANYGLSYAVGYAPNLVCQKEPEPDTLAKLSLALPNLLPEQFSFLGSQRIEKLKVTESGVSIGIGMDPTPIRFAKSQPVASEAPEKAPAAAAPEEAQPPRPEAGLRKLGHFGTVAITYRSFTDEILRPLMNQVAIDLGIDIRGLTLSGNSGGLILNLGLLDMQGMLAKLGASASPTVKRLLNAFKWQRFENVSIPLSAQWNADSGKLVFTLGDITGSSADGTSLKQLVDDLRASGLLRALPGSGAMAIVDRANEPLKLSFDLSSVSVKELRSMGFNERLTDNVGDIRFRQNGVSLDLGKARPNNSVIESTGMEDSALNAELDLGAIVSVNQGLIKNTLQSKGILTDRVSVSANAKDGTLTVDLDKTNFDGLFDAWGGGYKLLKFFARTPGMSVKLRPAFDPVTGLTTIAITDISVKGVLGPLTGFFLKMFIKPSWISANAPGMLRDMEAGDGALVRVAFTPSNLLPSALAGFGSQKISGLRVTGRGLAMGVGTNWRTNQRKSNQDCINATRKMFERTAKWLKRRPAGGKPINADGPTTAYLRQLAVFLNEEVEAKALRDWCATIKDLDNERLEELRQGHRRILELVADERTRRELEADELEAASFPDIVDLADALFKTLREE